MRGEAFRKFYQAASRIPKGKIATYGMIAQAAGCPGAARAVGNAMAKNTDTRRVPCHRVVKSDGTIGGYQGNPEGWKQKTKKLAREKIPVDAVTGKIKNFKKFLIPA